MKFEKDIMEWAADGAAIVKAWIDENDAQLALFKNPDGTFDLIRAFDLCGKPVVSVDRRNFVPRMPVPVPMPSEMDVALLECISGKWRDFDYE